MLGDLNPDQIEALLRNEAIGRIGCSANGITYVVPITYVYEDGYIYAHSREGMKIQMMRLNPMVCFEIDKMDDFANWQSVVAWGRYEELKGHDQKMGLQKLVSKFSPMTLSETSMPTQEYEDAHQNSAGPFKAIIYRIKLLDKTGKFEKHDFIAANKSSTSSSAKKSK
ncbi:MAG TPA: pyridoxamine 5'-phosphate oxidase family protein [Chitinophagales bacterium]|nr:pyridoxamine 5'-phosphate oxidase family protein [Chitinophagales bacterium]